MGSELANRYLELLDRSLYTLDAGTQYGFLNALVRSVLQTAAFAVLDYCHEEVDDIEQTAVPGLAFAMLAPSDGAPGRIIDTCLPLVQQAGWTGCCRAWFARASIGSDLPLNRRVEQWVRYRNDRPAHGVVAQDTVREALTWLPRLARTLVEALTDLLPTLESDGRLVIRRNGLREAPPVIVSSLRLHNTDEPIVVRSIAPRGPSWRVTYQSVAPDHSQEGTFELAPAAPLIALTRLEQRLYRSWVVDLDGSTAWKPDVLLPARQTTTFEGRAQQLAAIHEWMNDGDSRVCNVFGDGGIGKTTLVTEYLNGILSGSNPPAWRPDVICFFSAKETRWGPDGLERLRGAVPSLEDAAREVVRCYEERLDRSWFEGDTKQIVDRAATLMSGLGLGRNSILLVLDNAETLARSADEEVALGKAIAHLGKRLCRVLITSRRREKVEAYPIDVPPMADEEAVRLLRRLAQEYHAAPLRDAGDSLVRKVTRQFGGRPLLLETVARLVGTFGYSIDRGIESTMSLAAGDLGTFLYEDAWIRIGSPERSAFLVIGQLGGTVSGDIIGWACAELGVSHSAVLSAFEETRFGNLLDYGAHFDLCMDPSARAFLTQKFSGATAATRELVGRAAARVQDRHRQLLVAQGEPVNDRVAQAFRTDAARAAHRAARAHQVDDALRWYEEAIQVDRGNAALLDRFAWYLMKECKDLVRALQVATQACAADPSDADAHFTAGMIQARIGDPKRADELIAKAERLGKPPHLCALQQARARTRALELLLGKEPVDIQRANDLAKEGGALLERGKLTGQASALDAKHEAERSRTKRRLDSYQDRLDSLRVARLRS